MESLGRIESVKKMACPHCRQILDDEDILQALEGEDVFCPYCKNALRLPQEVVERYQRRKYVGTNLDITC